MPTCNRLFVGLEEKAGNEVNVLQFVCEYVFFCLKKKIGAKVIHATDFLMSCKERLDSIERDYKICITVFQSLCRM